MWTQGRVITARPPCSSINVGSDMLAVEAFKLSPTTSKIAEPNQY